MKKTIALLSIAFIVLAFAAYREAHAIKLRGYVTSNGVRHEASSIRTYHGYMVWEDMQGRRFTEYGNVTIEYSGCP